MKTTKRKAQTPNPAPHTREARELASSSSGEAQSRAPAEDFLRLYRVTQHRPLPWTPPQWFPAPDSDSSAPACTAFRPTHSQTTSRSDRIHVPLLATQPQTLHRDKRSIHNQAASGLRDSAPTATTSAPSSNCNTDSLDFHEHLNEVAWDGFTPLLLAASMLDLESVLYLLYHGADSTATTREKRFTAAHLLVMAALEAGLTDFSAPGAPAVQQHASPNDPGRHFPANTTTIASSTTTITTTTSIPANAVPQPFSTAPSAQHVIGSSSLSIPSGSMCCEALKAQAPQERMRYLQYTLATLQMHGCDVCAADAAGHTLLHMACAYGASAHFVDLLLELGLHPLARDAAGITPLLVAATFTPPVSALRLGKLMEDNNCATIKLLLQYPATCVAQLTSVDRVTGFSPLHWCIVLGKKAAAQLLIGKDSDGLLTRVVSRHGGHSAMHAAIRAASEPHAQPVPVLGIHAQMLSMLCRWMGKIGCEEEDSMGRTPLDLACELLHPPALSANLTCLVASMLAGPPKLALSVLRKAETSIAAELAKARQEQQVVSSSITTTTDPSLANAQPIHAASDRNTTSTRAGPAVSSSPPPALDSNTATDEPTSTEIQPTKKLTQPLATGPLKAAPTLSLPAQSDTFHTPVRAPVSVDPLNSLVSATGSLLASPAPVTSAVVVNVVDEVTPSPMKLDQISQPSFAEIRELLQSPGERDSGLLLTPIPPRQKLNKEGVLDVARGEAHQHATNEWGTQSAFLCPSPLFLSPSAIREGIDLATQPSPPVWSQLQLSSIFSQSPTRSSPLTTSATVWSTGRSPGPTKHLYSADQDPQSMQVDLRPLSHSHSHSHSHSNQQVRIVATIPPRGSMSSTTLTSTDNHRQPMYLGYSRGLGSIAAGTVGPSVSRLPPTRRLFSEQPTRGDCAMHGVGAKQQLSMALHNPPLAHETFSGPGTADGKGRAGDEPQHKGAQQGADCRSGAWQPLRKRARDGFMLPTPCAQAASASEGATAHTAVNYALEDPSTTHDSLSSQQGAQRLPAAARSSVYTSSAMPKDAPGSDRPSWLWVQSTREQEKAGMERLKAFAAYGDEEKRVLPGEGNADPQSEDETFDFFDRTASPASASELDQTAEEGAGVRDDDDSRDSEEDDVTEDEEDMAIVSYPVRSKSRPAPKVKSAPAQRQSRPARRGSGRAGPKVASSPIAASPARPTPPVPDRSASDLPPPLVRAFGRRDGLESSRWTQRHYYDKRMQHALREEHILLKLAIEEATAEYTSMVQRVAATQSKQ